AFDSISDELVSVLGFYTGEGVEGWTVYTPGWPTNTLETLYLLRGYFVNVSEDVTWQYGTKTYELTTGWNMIGW
ncbi:hypothetical protein ACFLVK_01975, partial [Chloroflexota bacterium]